MSPERALVEEAMEYLNEHLKPERALVVIGSEGTVRGLDASQLWLSAPVSHHILRQLLESGEPMNSVDAANDPDLSQRTSVMLSDIRSVIGVPLKNGRDQVVGLLYADNRVRVGAFKDEAFSSLLQFCKQLQQRFTHHVPNAPILAWEQLVAIPFR